VATERERGKSDRIRVLTLVLTLLSLLTGFGCPVWGAAGPDTQRTTGVIHSVQSGDNLRRIDLRHGVTLTGVVQADGLVDPDYICAGESWDVVPSANGDRYL